ncbi:MAG: acyl-CoA thioesterase [Spirosomaceae bacterium]|jgi:acyl-CoA thioester hydrolase|nr:acyl-CoA thioesterase [Spirosomataceae bacterium]
MFEFVVGKEYPKITESRAIIRFQDCDPLQHLNNSKYFDYYFNAREDQVAKLYGFKFSEVFKNYRTSWVVYQHQIAYLRPANVSEWIRIYSRIIYFDADTLVTEYFMTDDSKNELKNVMWTTSKYISVESGKRVPHQKYVTDYLAATCETGVDFKNISFNDRIKQIKGELLNNLSSL